MSQRKESLLALSVAAGAVFYIVCGIALAVRFAIEEKKFDVTIGGCVPLGLLVVGAALGFVLSPAALYFLRDKNLHAVSRALFRIALPLAAVLTLAIGPPKTAPSWLTFSLARQVWAFYPLLVPAVAIVSTYAVLWHLLPNHYEDPTVCSHCGYDLTGNVSGICPECGTSFSAARKDDEPCPP